jgi:hypothetical protein
MRDHEKRTSMVLSLERSCSGGSQTKRWIQGEPLALEDVLETMRERPAKFNVQNIQPQDPDSAAGPPDEEA